MPEVSVTGPKARIKTLGAPGWLVGFSACGYVILLSASVVTLPFLLLPVANLPLPPSYKDTCD